ncbi:hypothetical protein BLA29_008561 [Euroglyphus maynei]|uniref:Uncharacterized protein n=1 Tax=Euroglyphus maynei TaxID=6958 RepID=A0A1Y3BM00_EURMA|nr:hypothetical protein BLA29_008561 [Euroglyphus maynei]
MNKQLERCIRDIHYDEQDLSKKVDQRLQYITDMNQLLQLKINMLEKRFAEHFNPTTKPSPSSMATNNHGYLATKMAYDQMSTATLSSAIFSNQSSISTSKQQHFEMINQPTKTIAYVMPNIRSVSGQSLPQQQQHPSSSSSRIQRSISSGETSNATDPNDDNNNSEHHSRRCRRHHRIRLFSHRRRH